MKVNLIHILSWQGLKTLGVLLLALISLTALGCDKLLDVDNPNNVLEESLTDPSAATAIANGVLSTGAQGISYCLAPYTVATDEGIWIGSRDAWNQLDHGNVDNTENEFVDAAWPLITEARYTADNAIERLTAFQAASTLKDPKNLARAYLYSAMIRVTIADMFDDFVYSNKREAKPPIGPQNMSKVYDEAIAHLDAALAIPQAASDLELKRRILGMRARAKHAKAVWALINPSTQTPSNPYVNAGADDAAAALAAPMAANYRWQLVYTPGVAFNEWAWEVVGRSENDVAKAPKDIIDSAVDDPRIVAETKDFKDKAKWGGNSNSAYTMISEREMQLIIAESKVVSDPVGAEGILNALRARDGLKPLAAPVTVGQLLQHERRANLFMMGRRLSDMYRFGIKSATWEPISVAFKTSAFFPITIQEIRANPLVAGGR